ncbi:rRNA adenine N-6-methyltransferase family protein [Nocardiopsis tropica]|uniref:rRNA adenine N-6-methyltransferase family protein n=1 Tax=Nocardiopsis tropica TaxID=109330 RepID=UPI002E8A9302|nr:rRNA adenine N-6-methyltransferase family protein [Nocardiopsis tropica]
MTTPGARLARALTIAGHIIDPQWHRAILAVDRAGFIPDTVWVTSTDHPGYYMPVSREDPDHARWAHEDYALATQVDDGNPAGGPNGEPGWGRLRTSSLSQPSLVVDMLQQLDAAEGHRVLEIGTGSGYNTALLCHALGEKAVVSAEIDTELARVAVDNLDRAGYRPTVLDEDGAEHLETGLGTDRFHRVISTVAARGSIPHAWVGQTWPGGVIVTPWEVGTRPGVLVRLEVGEDDTAHGRIVGEAPFMVLRSQRPDSRRIRDLVDEEDPGKQAGTTTVNPRLVAYEHPGWQLVLGHLVPDLRYAVYEASEERPECAGEASVYVATPDGSWALGEYTPAGGPYATERAGGRDLWAEVGAAWEEWQRAGRPGREQLGVTVDAGGTRLWAGSPAGVLRPLGSAATVG